MFANDAPFQEKTVANDARFRIVLHLVQVVPGDVESDCLSQAVTETLTMKLKRPGVHFLHHILQ